MKITILLIIILAIGNIDGRNGIFGHILREIFSIYSDNGRTIFNTILLIIIIFRMYNFRNFIHIGLIKNIEKEFKEYYYFKMKEEDKEGEKLLLVINAFWFEKFRENKITPDILPNVVSIINRNYSFFRILIIYSNNTDLIELYQLYLNFRIKGFDKVSSIIKAYDEILLRNKPLVDELNTIFNMESNYLDKSTIYKKPPEKKIKKESYEKKYHDDDETSFLGAILIIISLIAIIICIRLYFK